MKTFRFIGMALFAVLMCVNFTSCSSDDDPTDESPQYELVTSGKKLAKIEYTLSDPTNDFIEIWDFTYDSEGKLIEATFTDSYNNKTKTRYTWNNNLINVHEMKDYNSDVTQDTEYMYTYNFKNGLVQNLHDIKYDDTNRPKEIMGSTIMWDEDKLTRISTPYQVSENQTRYDFTQYYYSENGTTCNGYNPFIPFLPIDEERDFLFMVHPEIAGMRSTQIPVSYLDQDVLGDMTQGTYSHRLDNEGYISEFRKKEKGGRSDYIYTMTWK